MPNGDNLPVPVPNPGTPTTPQAGSMPYTFTTPYADTTYIKPQMNLYGVYEPDLENLSGIGVRANVFLAVLGFTASSALACVLGAVSTHKTERTVLIIAAVFFLLLSGVFALLTYWELQSKDTIVNRIKRTKVA